MIVPIICPVCPTKHKSREFYIDVDLNPHGEITVIKLVCSKCGAKWTLEPQVTRVKIRITESPLDKKKGKVTRC